MKDHLLSLAGLTRASTRSARFFDADQILIAEVDVTADECFVSDGFWSLFALADGPTARRLNARFACWSNRPNPLHP
jgi:hypothetical protein